METLGMVLIVLALLVGFVSYIWRMVLAFQQSLVWGLGSLLFTPLILVFGLLHWSKTKQPFLSQCASAGLWALGMGVASAGS